MLCLGIGLNKSKLIQSKAQILTKLLRQRVILDSGIFEAKTCLVTTLTNLNKI